MSKFKCEITLQQVTPMIHFQAEDYGACLRATDVKPRLDKYLSEREDIKSAWYIDQEKKGALDYRVCFSIGEHPKAYRSNEKNKNIKNLGPQVVFPEYFQDEYIELPKAYFGNMTSKKDAHEKYLDYLNIYREAVLFETEILMTIFSEHSDLLEIIRNNIEDFFLVNNFGTRSDKGLGSFYVSKVDDKDMTPSVEKIKNVVRRDVYKISLKPELQLTDVGIFSRTYKDKKGKTRYEKNCLDIINSMYSNMKSGHSIPKPPVTGYLLEEYYSGKRNDRDFVKDVVFDGGKQGDSYQYFRVYLGLCDHMDFLKGKYEGRCVKVTAVNRTTHEEIIDERKKIDRIPSPILFKVIPNEIVVIPEYDLSEEIKRRVQNISFKFVENAEGAEPFYLEAPADFSIDKFFKEFVKDQNHSEIFVSKDIKNVKLTKEKYKAEGGHK